MWDKVLQRATVLKQEKLEREASNAEHGEHEAAVNFEMQAAVVGTYRRVIDANAPQV